MMHFGVIIESTGDAHVTEGQVISPGCVSFVVGYFGYAFPGIGQACCGNLCSGVVLAAIESSGGISNNVFEESHNICMRHTLRDGK
jgi:hypothetical protein